MKAVTLIEGMDYGIDEWREEYEEIENEIDDEEGSVAYERKVERFTEILNEVFEKASENLNGQERMIMLLLLKGLKKVQIADAMGVSVHVIDSVEKKICIAVARELSLKTGKECSEKMITLYLKSVKEYILQVNRAWEQWAGYREKVMEEKERKIKQALQREINIKEEKYGRN